MDPDGRVDSEPITTFEKHQLDFILSEYIDNLDFDSAFLDFSIEFGVGLAISANILGAGFGFDFGSLRGTFSTEHGYYETDTLGIEFGMVDLLGVAPHKEPSGDGKGSILNMVPELSIAGFAISEEGLTINYEVGGQAVIGITAEVSYTIPWRKNDEK